MATLYVLAHFDDEYFAWPMIAQGVRAGVAQHLVYVADYPTPALSARRRDESVRALGDLGVPRSNIVHIAEGVADGAVHRHLPQAFAALRRAVARMPEVNRIVVSAWEGGHADHDACAAMAAALAAELGNIPVDQFSLYSGKGLAGPLFRAGAPLGENGPRQRIGLSPAMWLRFMAAVRFYPSQRKTWFGLWPAMWWSYLRRGYGFQRLDPERLSQRPHAGPLLYERRFKVAYEEVQALAGAITNRPRTMRP